MDMQKMLKQAKKMQAQLAEVQDSLAEVTVDATAGGGMVKATMNGAGELQSITIDPQAVDPDDVELLQDMIVAAVNEASRNAQELANQRMSSVTNGLNIPGMSGLGF
ncbi:MAG: YbaB/EbfC family nucleoid-associated protein [Coriobacteriales bacterium]|jgi:DNA-binding YbaB/EbfC family protein